MYEVWSNTCGLRRLRGSYASREEAEKAMQDFDSLLNPDGFRESDLDIVER